MEKTEPHGWGRGCAGAQGAQNRGWSAGVQAARVGVVETEETGTGPVWSAGVMLAVWRVPASNEDWGLQAGV